MPPAPGGNHCLPSRGGRAEPCTHFPDGGVCGQHTHAVQQYFPHPIPQGFKTATRDPFLQEDSPPGEWRGNGSPGGEGDPGNETRERGGFQDATRYADTPGPSCRVDTKKGAPGLMSTSFPHGIFQKSSDIVAPIQPRTLPAEYFKWMKEPSRHLFLDS